MKLLIGFQIKFSKEIFNDGFLMIAFLPKDIILENSINDSSRLGNDVFIAWFMVGWCISIQRIIIWTNIMHLKKEENVDTELMGI